MANMKVEKALSPEDQTALANIVAIAQEILQSGSEGGEEAMKDQYTDPKDEDKKPEEGNVNKKAFEGKETPEEEKEEMAKKAIENTKGDGGDASTEAEDLEEENNTEATNEAVAQVAKMLLALSGKTTVKKAKPSADVAALQNVAKAISVIANRQSKIEKTLENLLNVTGITSQLEVVKKSQEPKTAPVQANDLAALASFIAKSIDSSRTKESMVNKSQAEQVSESLLDIVGSFNGRR